MYNNICACSQTVHPRKFGELVIEIAWPNVRILNLFLIRDWYNFPENPQLEGLQRCTDKSISFLKIDVCVLRKSTAGKFGEMRRYFITKECRLHTENLPLENLRVMRR